MASPPGGAERTAAACVRASSTVPHIWVDEVAEVTSPQVAGQSMIRHGDDVSDGAGAALSVDVSLGDGDGDGLADVVSVGDGDSDGGGGGGALDESDGVGVAEPE